MAMRFGACVLVPLQGVAPRMMSMVVCAFRAWVLVVYGRVRLQA